MVENDAGCCDECAFDGHALEEDVETLLALLRRASVTLDPGCDQILIHDIRVELDRVR
jgi:hypothetical protein